MKRIFMLVFPLLLLAGGGYAIYMYFLIDNRGELASDAIDAITEIEWYSDEKLSFLKLDPFILPMFDADGGISRHVSVTIALEFESKSGRERVMNLHRQLRDAYLSDMMLLIERMSPEQEGLSVRRLKRRLMYVSDRILGKQVIKTILIQGIFERQLG